MKLRHWIALFVLAFIVIELCDPSTPFIRVSAPVSSHDSQNHDLLDQPSTHSAIPSAPILLVIEPPAYPRIASDTGLENQHRPPTRKRPPIDLA